MDHTIIYKETEAHVTGLFEKNARPALVYHNLEHTKMVVDRVKEIAAHYQLIETDVLTVYVAAWFHDTGYLDGEPNMHEERSVDQMRDFMQRFNVDEALLDNITECILATKFFAEPTNLLQQIICDADTYHFGTKEFEDINQKVYEEFKMRNAATDKLQWDKDTLGMLKRHDFYTSYCINELSARKLKNMKKLKKRVTRQEEEQAEKPALPGKPKEMAPTKEQAGLITKGIQTMLRLTSENHMKLSDMADGKANILISVNSIIISVIITVMLKRIQVDSRLTVPTVVFLGFTLVTVILAILATRPKVNEGTFNEQDIIDKKTNLLFFGSYHKTPFDTYQKAMQRMMKEPDYLYGTLVKDIYQQGVVLARKFRLIRYAYNVFMVGIIISTLAFAWVSFGDAPDGVITNASNTPLEKQEHHTGK